MANGQVVHSNKKYHFSVAQILIFFLPQSWPVVDWWWRWWWWWWRCWWWGIKNLYCCNSHLEHQGVYGTLWAETVPLSSEISERLFHLSASPLCDVT